MAEPTPAGWPPAPEVTPASGTPSETVPPRDNWVFWAMMPPPPPPVSFPAAWSEPCQKGQPHVQTQPPSGALPPFDGQLLPAAQPPFDAQAPPDVQPQFSGQPVWNFQASAPWYWGLSPNGYPAYNTSYHSSGKLLLLVVPLCFLSFFFSPLSQLSLFISQFCHAFLEAGNEYSKCVPLGFPLTCSFKVY